VVVIIYILFFGDKQKARLIDRALLLVSSINTSYPVMRVLPATATTATIACTDRVVILHMCIFVNSISSKTKNPGLKARVRISF
jgi:hypothetical protein